jgi:hypothetical protein
MMSKFRDLTTQTFGLLTVLGRAPNNKRGRAQWICACSCDQKTITVAGCALLSGRTQSCGCFRRRHGGASGQYPVEYSAWANMLDRVYNERNPQYKNYGGRGLSVCNRWRFGEDDQSGFLCFLEDMGQKLHPKLSIERRNNDGNYSPENCYWGTKKEQSNNTRRNVFFTFHGETQTLAQWCRKFGWERKRLRDRLRTLRRQDARIRQADATSAPKMVAILVRQVQALTRDLTQAGL